METLNRRVPSGFSVGGDLLFNGMADGDLTAVNGANLQMNGMVCGDLHVAAGAVVVVNGTVSGKIIMRGGDVEIHGVVGGVIKANGNVAVKEGAYVSGRKAASDYTL